MDITMYSKDRYLYAIVHFFFYLDNQFSVNQLHSQKTISHNFHKYHDRVIAISIFF